MVVAIQAVMGHVLLVVMVVQTVVKELAIQDAMVVQIVAKAHVLLVVMAHVVIIAMELVHLDATVVLEAVKVLANRDVMAR